MWWAALLVGWTLGRMRAVDSVARWAVKWAAEKAVSKVGPKEYWWEIHWAALRDAQRA